MSEFTWSGTAVATVITSAFTNVSPGVGDTFTVDDATGHPSPSSSAPSVLTIDRGETSEEKILVDNRTGTTYRVLQRGYDGTAAASHTSGQATVHHTIAAAVLDALTDHLPATGQHVTAEIADAAITTAKIADANVTTAKIADANVTTAKIADGNVTRAKLDSPPKSIVGPFSTDSVNSTGFKNLELLSGFSSFYCTHAGSIVGLNLTLTAAVTAGTITLAAYKNGSAIAGATVEVGVGEATDYAVFDDDLYTFAAGDYLDLAITSASLTPSGALTVVAFATLSID